MKEETNNIIQGLLFLSTKYPEGRILGGGIGYMENEKWIDFILSKNCTPLVSLKDINYLESLGWEEYEVDCSKILSPSSFNIRTWRFYNEPFEPESEEEDWEDI